MSIYHNLIFHSLSKDIWVISSFFAIMNHIGVNILYTSSSTRVSFSRIRDVESESAQNSTSQYKAKFFSKVVDQFILFQWYIRFSVDPYPLQHMILENLLIFGNPIVIL